MKFKNHTTENAVSIFDTAFYLKLNKSKANINLLI